jgi:hypothetical protein
MGWKSLLRKRHNIGASSIVKIFPASSVALEIPSTRACSPACQARGKTEITAGNPERSPLETRRKGLYTFSPLGQKAETEIGFPSFGFLQEVPDATRPTP